MQSFEFSQVDTKYNNEKLMRQLGLQVVKHVSEFNSDCYQLLSQMCDKLNYNKSIYCSIAAVEK